jgi:hypothetical protein
MAHACVTCLGNDFVDEEGLWCKASGERHFICQVCLDGYVRLECDTENVHKNRRRGHIFCPNCPVDGQREAAQGGLDLLQCDSGPYSHTDLAANLSESTFNLYIDEFSQCKSDEAVEQALGKVSELKSNRGSANMLEKLKTTLKSPDLKSFKGNAQLLLCTAISTVMSSFDIVLETFRSKTMEDIRLSLALKRQMPQARQCGSCGFGPVDIYGCADLVAHHGQAVGLRGRIQNTCPNCGWFASSSSEWPKWDGVVSGGSVTSQIVEFYFAPTKDRFVSILKKSSSSMIFWVTVAASVALMRYCNVRISCFGQRPSLTILAGDLKNVTSMLSAALRILWSSVKIAVPKIANVLWIAIPKILQGLLFLCKFTMTMLALLCTVVAMTIETVLTISLKIASIAVPPVLALINSLIVPFLRTIMRLCAVNKGN